MKIILTIGKPVTEVCCDKIAEHEKFERNEGTSIPPLYKDSKGRAWTYVGISEGKNSYTFSKVFFSGTWSGRPDLIAEPNHSKPFLWPYEDLTHNRLSYSGDFFVGSFSIEFDQFAPDPQSPAAQARDVSRVFKKLPNHTWGCLFEHNSPKGYPALDVCFSEMDDRIILVYAKTLVVGQLSTGEILKTIVATYGYFESAHESINGKLFAVTKCAEYDLQNQRRDPDCYVILDLSSGKHVTLSQGEQILDASDGWLSKNAEFHLPRKNKRHSKLNLVCG